MRVAYRRMSGAIGVTQWEQGTRGLWLEKRLAFVKLLRSRGHRVDWTNRMTKFSQGVMSTPYDAKVHELLIIEFGSSNRAFYGEDLAETERMVAAHRGRIIFLCDDPDLPYVWKSVSPSQQQQFICWYNASHPVAFGGQPDVPMRSFPLSGMMNFQTPKPTTADSLVYIGRPTGREKIFQALFAAHAPIEIYGREPEWIKFGCRVREAPPQTQRADFYAEKLGCLVIADKKHKRMGWYTGRAFHAIAAGCPAVAESDHAALTGLRTFGEAEELTTLVREWQEPHARALAWSAQKDWVKSLGLQCERVLQEVGL